MFKALTILALFLAGLSLAACGGGGGGGGVTGSSAPVATVEIKTGKFIDGLVEGLTYESGSQKGTTDVNGTFEYEEGNLVKFSVGGIVLGQAMARPIMSPVTLAPAGSNTDTPEVIARVRFLMAISDIDGAGNMKILPVVRDKILNQSVDFAALNEAALSALVAALGSTEPLRTTEEAIVHIDASLGDTAPPSAPDLLTALAVAYNAVTLQWRASTDRVGVVGYFIYRDAERVGQTTGIGFTDTLNVEPNTTYRYQISAYDAAGNISGGSNVLTVKTDSSISVTISGNVTP